MSLLVRSAPLHSPLLGRWVLPRQVDPSTTTDPTSAPSETPSSIPPTSKDPTTSDPTITLDWAACHTYETCDTSQSGFWKCPDGSIIGIAQTCPPIFIPWSACHDPPTADDGCKVDPVGVPRLWSCADGSQVALEEKCPEANPNQRIIGSETSSSSAIGSTPSSNPDGQRTGGPGDTGGTGEGQQGEGQGSGQGGSGSGGSQQSALPGPAISSATTLASGTISLVRVGTLTGMPSATFQRTATASQTSNGAARSKRSLRGPSKARMLSAGAVVLGLALGMVAAV